MDILKPTDAPGLNFQWDRIEGYNGDLTSSKRYIFTTKDPDLANTLISVMALSSAPVAITGVSRNAGTGLITINLNGTPSAEEKVYVRYTDSAWKYSQVIQATVAGNTATARGTVSSTTAEQITSLLSPHLNHRKDSC